MPRDLITFPLSQCSKLKLSNSGFLTTDDLKEFKPSELSKETGLTAEEALDVLKIVFSDSESQKRADILSCSAYDILTEEKSILPLSTSCSALDDILGGGIAISKVTELCGCPGSGKTQLCLQLCANVTIPERFGGLNGEALYIDTEGSFIIQRLAQMANSVIKKCRKKEVDLNDFTIEKILKSIYYYPCKSYTEVIARINLLHEFLEKHKEVRLIIVDSITFHFRYGFEGSYALRTRLLNGIMQVLVKVAHDYKLAVVLTNQMTTKIDPNGGSHLIPALGESWGHACTVRLILSWTEGKRQAYLLKSPTMPETSVFYRIHEDGIKDEAS